jgi:hypothetical protein
VRQVTQLARKRSTAASVHFRRALQLDFGHSGWIAECGSQSIENFGLGFRDVSGFT